MPPVGTPTPDIPFYRASSTQWFILRPGDLTVGGRYILPEIGQQARVVEIPGPFDGNLDNTTLRLGGQKVPLLAESPRGVIFRSPTNVTGPMEIALEEGAVERTGPYRNVAVRLSAPKTNLMRDETTTVTIEVKGLEGIQKDVPLQINSKGVITMDGGNFQNLKIRPQEVGQDGLYTTNRAITGLQAGTFNVAATLIVRPFDVCIQDDGVPSRVMLWNTLHI